jgi:hypothetical protein
MINDLISRSKEENESESEMNQDTTSHVSHVTSISDHVIADSPKNHLEDSKSDNFEENSEERSLNPSFESDQSSD